MAKILDERVRSAQVDSLYRHSMTYVVFHPLAACLFLWTFWLELRDFPIIVWFAFVCVLSIVRYIAAYFYHYGLKSAQQIYFWEGAFIVLSFFQACTYTVMWVYLIEPDTPLNNAVIGLWLIALSACSVVGYSANLRGLFAFFAPVVIPGVITLMIHGGHFNLSIALSIVLYSVVVTIAMFPVYRSIKQSVTLNFALQKEIDQRKQAEGKLLALSRQDGLTGLANRRHFDVTLHDEIKRASRARQPIALVLLDIDYFKDYNDFYGHLAGDACLKHVANLLAEHVNRSSDLVARYGGEEFALILPNTTKNAATEIAISIQQSVYEQNIPHCKSKLAGHERLTISAGVAVIEANTTCSEEQLIAQTDRALYQAKRRGRNRVVCA